MNAPKKCQDCGAPLSEDSPHGLCGACLLRAGLTAPTEKIGLAEALPELEHLAQCFPQLEIIELLGKGGMGAVYKARQPALDRFVALKILPRLTADDPGFAERFNREARALARLNHPNIVSVYDFGQANGLHYFIMEYVDGPNLRLLEKEKKLSPREALQIIPQICEALQFAHDEGVVHRDIKPENVLIDRKGRVKIADFGLARIIGFEASEYRLTGARDIMGTPHYMAPEQVERPQSVDHRADIYSLGVVFYEMLTGELPLGKFEPPSHRVQVDVRLDEVVLHTLEKEPARRYQHANEVKTAVETIATTNRSAASGEVSPTGISSGKLLAIAAAVVVLGLAVVILARGHGLSARKAAPPANGESPASLSLAVTPPVVVQTVPPSGSVDVDPALQTLAVTFSRPMQPGNYSWVEAGKNLSPAITGVSRFDAEGVTCTLPVRLAPGRVYALWINSETFQNFRDLENRPSLPYLLIFKTKAGAELTKGNTP